MKNNLFTYATSELSQDAFICWLMSFAMKDARIDNALRHCVVAFIKEFIPTLTNMKDDDIVVTSIERQHGKIDVLLKINDQYSVIIEDKINTRVHDNQLQKYKDFLVSEGTSPKSIYGIYYKTGFESDTSSVKAADYAFFDRKRILSILNANRNGINNNIFIDYLDFYTEFEADVQKYKTLPVELWDYKMIQGFFDDLKRDTDFDRGSLNGNVNYKKVSNASGGFYGMWMFPLNKLSFSSIEYSPYLQMQFAAGAINICFKVSLEENTTDLKSREIRNALRNALRNAIVYTKTTKWIYDLEQFGYFKPSSFGSGKTMTLGTIWEHPQSQLYYSDIRSAFQKAAEEFGNVIAYCREKTKNS